MKKMFVAIIILGMIFAGLLIYRNNPTSNASTITVQEINEIENYISKIYMWKEITNEALPSFENIDQADEIWIWEVIKKNLEEYELSKEQIQTKAKEIFGEEFQKELPKEGNQSFEYYEETGKYYATETNLDQQEDLFLLENIEKTEHGYEVEIIEYIEDYGEESVIKIRNLQDEEIGQVGSNESTSNIQEIVKNNKDRFNKKKITIQNGVVCRVKKM